MQPFTDDLVDEIPPTSELANEKSLAEQPVNVDPPTDVECNEALPAEDLVNDDLPDGQDYGYTPEEQIVENPTPKGTLDEDPLIEEPVYQESYTGEQLKQNTNKEGIDKDQIADEPVVSDITEDDDDDDKEDLVNDDLPDGQDYGYSHEEQIVENPTPKGTLDEDPLIEEPVYQESYTGEQLKQNTNKEGIDKDQIADEPVVSDITDDDDDDDDDKEDLVNDDLPDGQDYGYSPKEQIVENPTPKGTLDEDPLIEEPVYQESYTGEQLKQNTNKEGIDKDQIADDPVVSDITDDDDDDDDDKDPDYAMSCNESTNNIDYDEYFPNQNNDPEAENSKIKKVKEIRKRKFEGLSENIGILPKKAIKDGCKQIYDKVNYCKFCQKEIKSKISRHLLTVHKDEVEVTNILLLPVKGKERTLRLELLANEGNFMHNTEVIKSGTGNLVVARRSGADSEIFHIKSDYLPCEHCKKFILKTSLWLHSKNCPVFHFFHKGDEVCGNGSDDNSIPIATNAVRKAKTLLHGCILDDDNEILAELFDRMHDGPIKDVVEEDKLIKRFCALKLESLGDPEDQKLNDIHRVSQSARSLARLVLEARKTKPKVDMNNLLQPDNFELCVKATKALSFEKENPAVSLGKLIGNLIGHIVLIKIGESLKKNNNEHYKAGMEFKQVFDAEWRFRVNAISTKKIIKAKRSEVRVIPLTEDLQKVRTYIMENMKKSYHDLKDSNNASHWMTLARFTLARLIVFNKRRRAEVKDLKVAQYKDRPVWQDDDSGELGLALTPMDKMLAER